MHFKNLMKFNCPICQQIHDKSFRHSKSKQTESNNIILKAEEEANKPLGGK